MGDFFPIQIYFDYPNAPKNLGVLGVIKHINKTFKNLEDFFKK